MFAGISPCWDHIPLVRACHPVKEVTLISLTYKGYVFAFEKLILFSSMLVKGKDITDNLLYPFPAFVVFYVGKIRFFFFLQVLTASECDLCHTVWYGNASCWRNSLEDLGLQQLTDLSHGWLLYFQWPVKSNFGKTAVLCAYAAWSFISDSAEALVRCSALNF